MHRKEWPRHPRVTIIRKTGRGAEMVLAVRVQKGTVVIGLDAAIAEVRTDGTQHEVIHLKQGEK